MHLLRSLRHRRKPAISADLRRRVEAGFARVKAIPPTKLRFNGRNLGRAKIPPTTPGEVVRRDDLRTRAEAELAKRDPIDNPDS